MKCPVCRKNVEEPSKGQPRPDWWPFCSERCKLIDLGKWLDSDYTIPAEPEPEDEDTLPD